MIVSLADSKTFLNISSNEHDALITKLINAAASKIQNYCGQPIEPTTDSEILDGTGSYFVLSQYTIFRSLTGVSYRSAIEADWTAHDVNDYTAEKRNSTIYIIGAEAFEYGFRNYKFDWELGFNQIPEAIQQVALEMVSKKYLDFAKNDFVGVDSRVQNIQGQQFQVKYLDLTSEHERILNAYRRFTF